jgi:hypothetical protein
MLYHAVFYYVKGYKYKTAFHTKMLKSKLFQLPFVKYYVESYTKSVIPIICLGIQVPIIIKTKKYTHLPFLFLFPVGYTAACLGLEMAQNTTAAKK